MYKSSLPQSLGSEPIQALFEYEISPQINDLEHGAMGSSEGNYSFHTVTKL
jgi:hypothetical protein